MPDDVVPDGGWVFWATLAVVAAVLTGVALARGSWVIVATCVLAVIGAADQALKEVRRDRATAERAAALEERLR